mgnify:CR=1 FL=1
MVISIDCRFCSKISDIVFIRDAVNNFIWKYLLFLSIFYIYQTGLYLTGGGALIRGLDKRIAAKTKLPVYVAEDPLRAVVRGTGIALKNIGNYKFLMQ